MAEEKLPEHVSAEVRRLLQEATRLSQTLEIVVVTRGSGYPAVASLVRKLAAMYRELLPAFEDSTGAPQAVAPDIGQLEDKLERTEARLAALTRLLAQLVGRLERPDATSRQHEDGTVPDDFL